MVVEGYPGVEREEEEYNYIKQHSTTLHNAVWHGTKVFDEANVSDRSASSIVPTVLIEIDTQRLSAYRRKTKLGNALIEF